MTFLDRFAMTLFGWTRAEAQAAGQCIRCRLPVAPEAWPDVDQNEYALSAICPACYVALFPDEEECE